MFWHTSRTTQKPMVFASEVLTYHVPGAHKWPLENAPGLPRRPVHSTGVGKRSAEIHILQIDTVELPDPMPLHPTPASHGGAQPL